MSRFGALNERQLDVLRWIGEGCPERAWPDHSHKTSAAALQSRGLVVVKRRPWSAVITEAGRYYVANERYPEPGKAAVSSRKPAPRAPAPGSSAALQRRPRIEINDLIDRLRVASGVLWVEDPDRELRAAYRRAISVAITSDQVPEGYRLRHTGRDRGDLIIRLVKADELPRAREPLAPIAVPDTLQHPHEAVAELAEREDGVAVSAEQRPRALRIIQGIADETRRRGYDFARRPNGEPGFRVTIGEDSFDFTIWEEHDKVDQYPADEVAAKKYPWQRVSLRTAMVPSGRLVLQLGDDYRPRRWADRKRWNLVDKLPEMFALIEDQAREAREAREQKREAARRRREQWEAAVPEARRQYLADLNRTRVIEQADAWRRARDLRDYATAVQRRAERSTDPAERQRVAAWAQWARDEADRLDPLLAPDALTFVTPEEIEPADLDRYMPPGMTVRHPPDESAQRRR